MSKLLVTGSSGLVGSEVVSYFCALGWEVHGIDNNTRANLFGPGGDTEWNRLRLCERYPRFQHHDFDIRERARLLDAIRSIKPDLIVHAAAQPSHDLAALRPFDDFDINAVGTLNLLEAARRFVPDAPFVYMSTNKVYGDRPNQIRLRELGTRWDYDDPQYTHGIGEDFSIDQSKHSLFGGSKLAADVMVQEYGRYFGMMTCCLRAGCVSGASHSGVELHGFLSYLIKCNVERRPYTIFGYKGKQVRDNIHAADVASFIHAFWHAPRSAEVYNIGGGRSNSVSILEAFDQIESRSGIRMMYDYTDKNREGDHICYITDTTKLRAHYPRWHISRSAASTFDEIYSKWRQRSIVRCD